MPSHHKKVSGFSLIGLFFSILCLFPGPSWGEKKTVKLGFMADITGPGFLIALSQKTALELGLEEINSSGGLLGRRVELIVRDSQMKPDLAARQTQELILRDKVDFVFGPTSPSVALAVSNVCKEQKKLLCLHSANNERLINELGHRYVFSVIPNTYMEGQALAAFLTKRGFKRILIIGPDLEYGHSQAAAFKKKIAEINPAAAIIKELWPRIGEPDYTPYIATILAAKPDMVCSFLWGGDLAGFMRQAGPHQFFQKTPFIGLFDYDLLKGLGSEMVPGLYGYDRAPFYALNNPQAKSFVERYKTRTGEYPSAWSILAYDGLMALRKAVDKAKSLETEKVIEALEGLSWESLRGPLHLRPQDHLASGGLFFGTTYKDPKYNFYIMREMVYLPGIDLWHSLEEIKSLRKSP
jgi:branched-chain amino acid transport system substrate-binding protein